jgi:hypothetical protein
LGRARRPEEIAAEIAALIKSWRLFIPLENHQGSRIEIDVGCSYARGEKNFRR